jgi:hypothetical protein
MGWKIFFRGEVDEMVTVGRPSGLRRQSPTQTDISRQRDPPRHRRIDPAELARLTGAFFEDMVKYVVDVELRVAGDPAIRDRVREITFELIGEGEPLP